MSKLLFPLLALGFALNAQAAQDKALVSCSIQKLSDAKKCMKAEAKAQPEYEEPNDVLVTNRKDLLADLINSLAYGDRSAELAKIAAADYVAVMVIHGDEHELVYYTLNKGANVEPQVLFSENVADLGYADAYDVQPLPSADLFFLGADGSKIDVYSDLESALEQAAEN